MKRGEATAAAPGAEPRSLTLPIPLGTSHSKLVEADRRYIRRLQRGGAQWHAPRKPALRPRAQRLYRAERTVRGKFELAYGGTLLLDEIADMSPAVQANILRAIEYGEFQSSDQRRSSAPTFRLSRPPTGHWIGRRQP